MSIIDVSISVSDNYAGIIAGAIVVAALAGVAAAWFTGYASKKAKEAAIKSVEAAERLAISSENQIISDFFDGYMDNCMLEYRRLISSLEYNRNNGISWNRDRQQEAQSALKYFYLKTASFYKAGRLTKEMINCFSIESFTDHFIREVIPAEVHAYESDKDGCNSGKFYKDCYDYKTLYILMDLFGKTDDFIKIVEKTSKSRRSRT